ncbi:hypothetical protein SAMN06265182_2015 [Persephonella hydrogeniphila]|uniref:Uncharacterized protein n=1 Tax=Persephonella hydrogeniphila TaxID=198703 RepID=A0A285NNU4_9AQUI|nr:hypothetical protein [Persephonella hydrogeniphila]SNZ11190.1 hypothetical protein SAMN06265182_2015 [Persephonella hydrogeniphila]
MDKAGSIRLHEAPPESVLAQVGDLHSTDILILLFLILTLGMLTFVFLVWRNSKKPPEERRSNFALFLIALNVGFFATVLFFVYRVVVIGIKYLMSQ